MTSPSTPLTSPALLPSTLHHPLTQASNSLPSLLQPQQRISGCSQDTINVQNKGNVGRRSSEETTCGPLSPIATRARSASMGFTSTTRGGQPSGVSPGEYYSPKPGRRARSSSNSSLQCGSPGETINYSHPRPRVATLPRDQTSSGPKKEFKVSATPTHATTILNELLAQVEGQMALSVELYPVLKAQGAAPTIAATQALSNQTFASDPSTPLLHGPELLVHSARTPILPTIITVPATPTTAAMAHTNTKTLPRIPPTPLTAFAHALTAPEIRSRSPTKTSGTTTPITPLRRTTRRLDSGVPIVSGYYDHSSISDLRTV